MIPGEKPVFGLIGGIGAGKSEIAAEFQRLGGAVVSGDRLGHEALKAPAIRQRVAERFGASVVAADGEVDRKKLAGIVFANAESRHALERIVFPEIEKGIAQEIARAQSDPAVRFITLDAAILLEAGWNKFCNAIVYVDAPREQRLARLAKQRGWTEKEVEAREQAQWSLGTKAKQAEITIDNSGPSSEAKAQAARFLQQRGFGVAN
jgi:dephospho-CoA kinase